MAVGDQVSRAERVRVSADALNNAWLLDSDHEDLAEAALTASDALLRTDKAVKRVARAMLHKEGYAVWEKIGRPSQLVWLDRAAVAINALLGEGE